MELHVPEHPIHSWRDVAIHLGIVTIGILIALGLEGVIEWRHHKSLAQEARENITSELRDNRAEVDGFIKDVPASRKQIETALRFTAELLAHRKINGNISILLHRSDVTDTSWTTAQAIGALTYMGYGEVKKFGAAYSLQQELVREQAQSFSDLSTAVGSMNENMGAAKPDDAELRTQNDRLNSLSSRLLIESQMAQALMKRYNSVLTGR